MTVPVAPDIIPTEDQPYREKVLKLGAGKHTSAGIMAVVHTPVVMVAGAAAEKAQRA